MEHTKIALDDRDPGDAASKQHCRVREIGSAKPRLVEIIITLEMFRYLFVLNVT